MKYTVDNYDASVTLPKGEELEVERRSYTFIVQGNAFTPLNTPTAEDGGGVDVTSITVGPFEEDVEVEFEFPTSAARPSTTLTHEQARAMTAYNMTDFIVKRFDSRKGCLIGPDLIEWVKRAHIRVFNRRNEQIHTEKISVDDFAFDSISLDFTKLEQPQELVALVYLEVVTSGRRVKVPSESKAYLVTFDG